MTGWINDDDNPEDWEPALGAFDKKIYRLPSKVLRQRWRLCCKREGRIVAYRLNNGLGLFDRRGHRLPDYVILCGKITIIRRRQFTPFLCLKPLASIYLMRGAMRKYVKLPDGRYWTSAWRLEHERTTQNPTSFITNTASARASC